MARGLQNNNPGNLRIGDEKFLGEIKPSQDKQFRQFENIAYGYRALFVQISLFLSRGINTIEKIIIAWAPPSENDTASYIATVEIRSGVDRHKILSSRSGDDCIKIVSAMSQVENGTPAVMADVEAGFRLQNKITR